MLEASAAQAIGAVLLAEGDAGAACRELRRSRALWQELEAPYEAARVRVLLSRACASLADADTASMERDAARWVFEKLGAAPDLAGVRHDEGGPSASRRRGGVTDRELEVLRLVVAGKTNREIARALTVSEHTVRRHLQNIFAKIGVSSRAGATAFALHNDLV